MPIAYYQTSWFRFVCGLAAAVMIWILCRIWLRFVATMIRAQMEARGNERLRVARALHDTLLQSVQGLMLRFHSAAEGLPEGEPVKGELREALLRADAVITEGRDRVQNLHRARLMETDFAGLISALGEELHWNKSIRFAVHVEGKARPLDPHVEEELCHIAREALVHAFTHSKAEHVQVEILYNVLRLEVLLREDGRGMTPDAIAGLGGMKERSVVAGGMITAWSGPGMGTEIKVSVPASKAYLVRPGTSRQIFQVLLQGPSALFG